MAKEEVKKEEKTVKIEDMVTVIGTEKAKFIPTGAKKVIHRIQAERLEKLGYVKFEK